MSVAGAVLTVLGIAPYAAEADSVITAGKDALSLILAAKELLESEEGQKFREKVEAIVAVSHEDENGSVHMGHEPRGRYIFDPLQGWVWTTNGG